MSFRKRLLLNTINRSCSEMNKLRLVILILFSCLFVKAQGPNLNLTGDAKEFDDLFNEISLVNGANHTGGAWYPQSFDLDSAFFVDVAVGFGGMGAEGLAIVIHSDSIPVGIGDEQLGVPNTGESFIVEFDLQQNASVNDARAPHSSFFKNGSLFHQGPDVLFDAPLTSGLTNSETFRISWDPQTHKFLIQRQNCTNSELSFTQDIKSTIFNGESKVFLGFTASTSAISDSVNLVLYNNSAGLSLDQTICQGEEVKLSAYNSIPTFSSNEPYTVIPYGHKKFVSGFGYEILAKPVNSGYYKVSRSAFCGTNEDSIWVEVLDTLSLSTDVITNEMDNASDISLVINDGKPPYDVKWILPDLSTRSDQDLVNVPFGVYQLSVTDNNQCSSNLRFELTPKVDISSEISEEDYFSPNNDGDADYIKINVAGESQIVDFSGKVLKTVQYGELWDGTTETGEFLKSGVYIVVGEEGKQVITILK